MGHAIQTLVQMKEMKSHLGILADDTNKDEDLLEFIKRITDSIESETGREFSYATYTEFHDGTGQIGELTLKQYPVDSSATFQIWDDTGRIYDAANVLSTDDYTVDNDAGIVRLDGSLVFNKGRNNIKVIYSAGYKEIPEDLKRAVILLASADFIETQGNMNINTEFQQASRIEIMRTQADKIIDKYRRPIF